MSAEIYGCIRPNFEFRSVTEPRIHAQLHGAAGYCGFAGIRVRSTAADREVACERQIAGTCNERGKRAVRSLGSVQNEAVTAADQIDLRELQIAVNLFACLVDANRPAPSTVRNNRIRVTFIEDVAACKRIAVNAELSTIPRIELARVLDKHLPHAFGVVGTKHVRCTGERYAASFNFAALVKRDTPGNVELHISGICKSRLMRTERAAIENKTAKRTRRSALKIEHGPVVENKVRTAENGFCVGVVRELQMRILKNELPVVARLVLKGQRIIRIAKIDRESAVCAAGHGSLKRGRAVLAERKVRAAPEQNGTRTFKTADRLAYAVVKRNLRSTGNGQPRRRTERIIGG